jgi:hypothetical protein
MPMVFLPVDRKDARQLREGGELTSRPGCAASLRLARAMDPGAGTEELEFVALSNASVLALTVGSDPLRLVLAVDVDPGEVTDPGGDLGEVSVGRVHWRQVQSLFADEPTAADAVARARAAAGGTLAEALGQEAVDDLLHTVDLLWFAPEELDQV